jgi:hypothetical protein
MRIQSPMATSSSSSSFLMTAKTLGQVIFEKLSRENYIL